jgi:hypothetical protein
MKPTTYFRIVKILAWFYGRNKILGEENLPEAGPAVFIANHLGPKGPIGTVCSIHLRFFPWIIADMVDKELAPDYLRWDFIEPVLKLRPPYSLNLAKALSLITVPMLSYLGCVPVKRGHYTNVQDSLQESVNLLKEGKILLIFPEAPECATDPHTKMKPFLKGFTRLGEVFFQETGEKLTFVPIAIHESKQIMVGKPIQYDPESGPGTERLRLKMLLENKIRGMYLEIAKHQKLITTIMLYPFFNSIKGAFL